MFLPSFLPSFFPSFSFLVCDVSVSLLSTYFCMLACIL
jgi:hypothetical protein